MWVRQAERTVKAEEVVTVMTIFPVFDCDELGRQNRTFLVGGLHGKCQWCAQHPVLSPGCQEEEIVEQEEVW